MRVTARATVGAVSAEDEDLSRWDPVSCHGYEVQYADVDGDGEWIKCPKTTAAAQSITGLTPGKRYAFRVRSFMKNAKGTFYSEYSSPAFLDM